MSLCNTTRANRFCLGFDSRQMQAARISITQNTTTLAHSNGHNAGKNSSAFPGGCNAAV